jgi:hypothetical protein
MTEVGAVKEPPDSDYLKGRGNVGYLPPIYRIKLPTTRTQSALVRWLYALGYEVKDIHKGLNVRYQQVRNMVTTQPKRAAREDLPPLVIELAEPEDIVEMLLGDELERTHMEAARQDKKAKKQEAQEEAPGSELDNEDYREHD